MIERLRRNALVACLAMAVAAAALEGNLWYPLAVVGGGLLSGISLASIARGVDGLAARRRAGLAVLAIAGRYALLAFLAYVMIARLRLPPLGLIAGASSVPVAVLVEALSKKPKP
ncbi:MAG TPA: hypothetical protein VL225_16460 [Vicinamibacterales bacterium]|jgi:hypothetical protein|nr:hypothetical protein [Vicinamibacterales bacterium]